MTREEAIGWAIKYISMRARKSHADYDEYVRRTKYIVNRIYDEFEEISPLEQRIAELEAPKTCKTCKWHKDKQCTNFNSIAFNSDNAVYEDDYCNDYEPKEIQ